MDTDSLLDEPPGPPEPVPNKPTANKINGENDYEHNTMLMNSNSNFNLVKRFNYTPKSDYDEENSSSSAYANYGMDPYTFLANTTNNLTSLLTNHKNYFTMSSTTPANVNTATNTGNQTEQQQQQRQTSATYLRNASARQIKSILKRSSSLDNNINMVGGQNGGNSNPSNAPMSVNFGIRASERNQVKDSIELANTRIVNKKEVSDENSSKRDKKSVRFAAQISEDDSCVKPAVPSLTVNHIFEYQVQPAKQKEAEPPPIPVANGNFALTFF